MTFNSNFSQDIPHQTFNSHKNIRKNHASNFFFQILIPSLSYLSLSIEISFPIIVNWVINLIIFQISSRTPRASPINSAIRTTLSLSLPFLAKKKKEKRKGKLQYPPSRYCRMTINSKLEPKWKSHPLDLTWNCHEFFHY